MLLCFPCIDCGAWPPQVDTTEQLEAWRKAHPCVPDVRTLRAQLAAIPPDPDAARHRRELAEALR